jgi:F-type H+-transporting ATPase subunit a
VIQALSTLASASPLGHVVDDEIISQDPFGMTKGGFFFSNVSLMLIVTGIVTVVLITTAAKRIATRGTPGQRTVSDYTPQGLLANFVESICVYLYDEIFKPLLKDETARFAPLLWSFFWFILVANVLGLIPLKDLTELIFHFSGIDRGGIGGTATQSIWVTATLAIIAFIVINVAGFTKDPVGYVKHLTGGAPFFMWPIMIPVEILGIFVKPFALAMRLFANMTGGHMVIASLLGFVPALIQNFGGVGGGISIIPILGSTAVNLLEILVAFIQAFVFTFLVAVFLSQVVVHEHHDGDHGHEPNHGADSHPAGHGH